jgi:hypothetical protein
MRKANVSSSVSANDASQLQALVEDDGAKPQYDPVGVVVIHLHRFMVVERVRPGAASDDDRLNPCARLAFGKKIRPFVLRVSELASWDQSFAGRPEGMHKLQLPKTEARSRVALSTASAST